MIERLHNINTINNKQIRRDHRQVGFNGTIATLAGKFETDPVLELLAIDLCGMIIPRTIIDLNRNKKDIGHLNWDAGRETGVRELSTAFLLYYFPGIAAYGLGNLLLKKLNPEGADTRFMRFGFLNAAKEHFAIDKFKDSKEVKSLEELKKSLIDKLIDQIEPEVRVIDKNSDKYTEFKNSINLFKEEFFKKFNDLSNPETQKELAKKLSACLEESNIKLTYGDRKFISSTGHFIRDLKDISETLIERSAKKAMDTAKNINLSSFAEHYNKLSKQLRSAKAIKLALGITAGMSALVAFPKFNMWLTKKISHKEYFPGTNGLINNDTQKAEEVKK